jgi:hypothetical protein
LAGILAHESNPQIHEGLCLATFVSKKPFSPFSFLATVRPRR